MLSSGIRCVSGNCAFARPWHKYRPAKRVFASSFVPSFQLGSVNSISSIHCLSFSLNSLPVSHRNGTRLVTKAMFERFTEKAIKVVMLAQEESRRLGHNFVGTEQILLGLIGESTGIAAKVLKGNGMNLKDARIEVQKLIGKGSGFVAVEIPFTPRAKRVLELALEEAKQLGETPSILVPLDIVIEGHSYIGTEHLLLGMLRETEGVAAKVFNALQVDPAKVRSQVGGRGVGWR